MKHLAKRTLKSGISLILVFCMVLGYFAMPASAEERAKTTFNYVSLGASNTNGYGIRGYITEEELGLLLSGQVSKDDVNVYGYERTPEGAYPDLIRDHYEGIYGKGNVNVHQLAISSMRVEELRILVDDTYMGDDYSQWRFTGSDGWFRSAEKGGLPALRQQYKNHLTNADLITVDIGWNNFGVYVCNQLVDYMSSGKFKWTTEVTSIFDTAAEDQAALEAKKIIKEYIEGVIGSGEMTNALADIFAYSILGYIHNFDIVIGKIYEMNPDADVVVLGIQNLLHGAVVEINGEKLPLGDIFGNFVNMANYYISACSPYQSRYQYVKAGKNEHVEIFLDFMKDYKGNAKDLNQNVKDCFDYYDNDLYLQTKMDYVAAELIKQMVAQELGEDMLDTALKVLECESWLDVVSKGKAGELPTNLLGKNYQQIFDSMYWPALYAGYDTLAVLVKEIANAPSVDASGLLGGTLNIGSVEDTIMKALEDEIMENAMAAANGEAYTVDMNKILPDADAKVVAAMYIRYYMGNSFFAHPSEEGHTQIKNAVINVINKPESESDQKLADYLMKSVKDIQKLLCEAAGHNFSDGKCISCGAEDPNYVPPTEPPHTHSYKEVVTKPTCTTKGYTTYTCDCGDTYTDKEVAATGHSYGKVSWTWLDDGSKPYISKRCDSCDDQVKVEATVTSKVITEATCTETGTTEHAAVATMDGKEYTFNKTETTAALGHDLELEWTWDGTTAATVSYTCKNDKNHDGTATATVTTETTDPTCTADGKTVYTATFTLDGVDYTDTKTEVIKATGHTYNAENVNWSWSDTRSATVTAKCAACSTSGRGRATITNEVTTAPTCIAEGVRTYTATATVNGVELTDTKTEAIPMVDHTFTDGKCSVCGEADPDYVAPPTTEPSHTHSYSVQVTKPTCTTKGYTTYTCSCGDSFIADEVAATGHTFGAWATVKDPTSKEVGKEERACACGEKETREISKLTNNFTDVKATDYYFEPVLWAGYKGITAGTSATTFGPSNACTRAQVVTFLWRAAGSPEPKSTENPFTDVKTTDYFYKAVLWARENNITSGVSATKFGSGAVCTRAQVVTFLWRAAGSPAAKGTNPFTDVKTTDYYCQAVLWAVENGITAGTSATTFGSSSNCVRGQIVTFLYKAYVK